jgi:transcriptional regulator with XRE-family HTH domain
MPARTTSPELAARIGQRLRQLRESCGLTQEAAAWAADLSKGYLSRVEAGQHLPSLDALDRLAAALGVTLADLVNVQPDEPRLALLEATRDLDDQTLLALLAQTMVAGVLPGDDDAGGMP